MEVSLFYFPTAVALGALHALEPGHAKTLTAAYLIGIKGTFRDAVVLGLSVAATHSIVVVGLSVIAVLLGSAVFTEQAMFYLSAGSSILVIFLGLWLLERRIHTKKSTCCHGHSHDHDHDHEDHDHHDDLTDDEHARAHAATMPDYVKNGERPTLLQIMMFGAAGGLVPCPAAVSVMLLSLSLSQSGKGLLLVLGFSFGLAITLVTVGIAVVLGLSKLASQGLFTQFSKYAPVIAAVLVIISGLFGLGLAFSHH